MYPKRGISPLNQNIQSASLNTQSYISQQNINARKISPSPPVNRVNIQGFNPNLNDSVNTHLTQTYNYSNQSQSVPTNNQVLSYPANNEVTNPINRSQSSSLTRGNYTSSNGPTYESNNQSGYYKGNPDVDRNNYSSPYKSSKNMDTNYNNNYGNYQPRNNYGNNNFVDKSGYQQNSFNYPPNPNQYRANSYNNNGNRYNSPGSNYSSYNNPSNYPSRIFLLIQNIASHTIVITMLIKLILL